MAWAEGELQHPIGVKSPCRVWPSQVMFKMKHSDLGDVK